MVSSEFHHLTYLSCFTRGMVGNEQCLPLPAAEKEPLSEEDGNVSFVSSEAI